VRIERSEHAFHRRRDQIVVAGLTSIHVILPDQLNGFGENRYLRVTVILFVVRGPQVLETKAKENAQEQQTSKRAE